jgi:hypothetical protein
MIDRVIACVSWAIRSAESADEIAGKEMWIRHVLGARPMSVADSSRAIALPLSDCLFPTTTLPT